MGVTITTSVDGDDLAVTFPGLLTKAPREEAGAGTFGTQLDSRASLLIWAPLRGHEGWF